MSTTIIDVYSDLAMQCPASYYGGYKKPWVLNVGDAELALSDPITGDVIANTLRLSLADPDGSIRAQLASTDERYWSQPLAFWLTTRANRAVLGRMFTAFIGHIIDAQPRDSSSPRAWDITLADVLSHTLLSDKNMVPWRLIRDGFLDQLDAVSDRLDLEQPEPILYGEHTREPGAATSSAVGYRIAPIYLGIETLPDMNQWHCWLVAGHACKEIGAQVYVDGEAQTETFGFNNWLIPGQAQWVSMFGAAKYLDKVSSTYGTVRRYTLIYGKTQGSLPFNIGGDADSCALGEKQLLIDVNAGIEEDGDGEGEAIWDFYQQYKHFAKNFLAKRGINSYQSGAWFTNPTWTLLDGTYYIVDEASFDAATADGLERLAPDGVTGAVAIGLRPGDRSSVKRWVADFNRSGWCRSGQTAPWQFGIAVLNPTTAIKAAAPLYRDHREILRGSFRPSIRWDRHLTHLPYRGDYDSSTGNWQTSGVIDTGESDNYEDEITGEIRERPFTPGATQATHFSTLEALILKHPPRYIALDTNVGPDANGDSLGYRNLGEYITYEHFDAIQQTRSVRLAQIDRRIIRGSARKVAVEAMDVEDYIDLLGGEGAAT